MYTNEMVTPLRVSSSRKNSIDVQVGGKIRRIRIDRGNSVRELALAIGVAPNMIESVETGGCRARPAFLFLVASHYELNLKYFFEDLY